jgi:hypothetical protein
VGAVYHATGWTGEAHLLQGDAARAVAEFEALAAINARWPSTLLFQARGLLALGRHEGAAMAADTCLASGPPRLLRARALATFGLALGLAKPAERERAEGALLESITLCEYLGSARLRATRWPLRRPAAAPRIRPILLVCLSDTPAELRATRGAVSCAPL